MTSATTLHLLKSFCSALVVSAFLALSQSGASQAAESTLIQNPPLPQHPVTQIELAQIELARKDRFEGDVVFMRGGFNVFSKGLDQMAERLISRGIKVDVVAHTDEQSVLQQILDNQKKYGRKPIVLVGHSWGANAVIKIADELRKKNIRVNYMVTFAATNPGEIPSNVRKATNYYFEKDGWGKPVKRGRGARGVIKNIDLSKTPGVHHFNIEKFPKLQNQVINNVLRFVNPSKRV